MKEKKQSNENKPPASNPGQSRNEPPARYRLPRPAKKPGGELPAHPQRPSIPYHANHLSAALRLCQDCAGSCLQTVNVCLENGGETAVASLQALLHDCADICETTARFIVRKSNHIPHLCRECAEICEICARDLDAISDNDCTHRCAQACRRCAEACNGVTLHHGEG